MKKKIIIDFIENNCIKNFTAIEKSLFEKAQKAAKNAYAPYSNFRVGAAVLLENGEIFSGSNQENVSFPIGICAEQVTLSAAHTAFPESRMVTLVITAYKKNHFIPVSPCGKCRQVILEMEEIFKHPIKIILVGRKKQLTLQSGKDLLPLSFSRKDLDLC